MTVGLITAVREVIKYASPIEHIVEIKSENSHTYQVAGYFVPEDKIRDLRDSMHALEDEARRALARMNEEDARA